MEIYLHFFPQVWDLWDIVEGSKKYPRANDNFADHAWRKKTSKHNQRLYSMLATSKFTWWKMNNQQM